MSPQEENDARAYMAAFIVAMGLCFSPLKSVAYALPTIVVSLLALRAPRLVVRGRATVMLLGWMTVGLAYWVLLDEFIAANYLLAGVTYSTLLAALLIDHAKVVSVGATERALSSAAWMVGVQGSLGIVQAFYGISQTGSFDGSNGDFVEGTIHPQLSAEYAFGNPMFAVNLTLMLIAIASVPKLVATRRRSLLLGVLAVILASVVHVILLAAAAILLARIVTPSFSSRYVAARQSLRRFIAPLLLAGGVLAAVALPRNLEQAGSYVARVTTLDESSLPRAIMLWSVFVILPDEAPSQPWIGLGPGQFSSRAALMASGAYLGGPTQPKQLPFYGARTTALAYEHCVLLLEAFADIYSSLGATNQPFFSWLSVYTEMGIIGVAMTALVIFSLLRRIRRSVQADPARELTGVCACAGIIFIALLGFVENYWETPQAILVGVMVTGLTYARAVAVHPSPRTSG